MSTLPSPLSHLVLFHCTNETLHVHDQMDAKKVLTLAEDLFFLLRMCRSLPLFNPLKQGSYLLKTPSGFCCGAHIIPSWTLGRWNLKEEGEKAFM